MSQETRETANTTITIWYKRVTGLGYEQTTTYEPVVTTACYEQGGSSQYTDTMGVMFTPRSIFWLEVLAENPRLGDYIALGDYGSVTDPLTIPNAEVIRISALQDCSELGDIDDLKLVT